MKKPALALGLLALLAGGTARAAAEWSASVQIVDIQASEVDSRPGVWLRFKPEPFPRHTCEQKTGEYRLLATESPLKQITSLAVSALLASRPVRVVWANNCDPSGYPIVRGIILQ